MIPENIKAAIDAHVKDGSLGGGFVFAMLSYNFTYAKLCGESVALRHMRSIMKYVEDGIPRECRGSIEKVYAWRKKKRHERDTVKEKGDQT